VLAIRSGGTEVLADGLDLPVGVTVAPDGSVLVSERGRVLPEQRPGRDARG
jgi:glucose/arabinose dehydrogenase